jgi:hypothetical protein
MYIYRSIITKHQLGKNVTAATNTHATVEELLDASFFMPSVSYERTVCYWFFPELLATLSSISSFHVIKVNLKNVVFWDVKPCRFVKTEVSEERIASIFRVEKSASEEKRQRLLPV